MKRKKIKAAALKYSKEDLDVPVIAALGEEEFARKIIEIAKKNGIKICQNDDFFKYEMLFQPGHEIPVDVYNIVVHILSCILNTNEREK